MLGYIHAYRECQLHYIFDFLYAASVSMNQEYVAAKLLKDDGEDLVVPLVTDGKKVYDGTYWIASTKHKPMIIVGPFEWECYFEGVDDNNTIEKYMKQSQHFIEQGEI